MGAPSGGSPPPARAALGRRLSGRRRLWARSATLVAATVSVLFASAGCSHLPASLRRPPSWHPPSWLARAAAEPVAIDPSATSSLPAPAGLEARSGELRSVPLRWEPLLDPAVAGYLVERAEAGSERFERIGVLRGAFSTSFVDRGLGPDAGGATAAARRALGVGDEPTLADGTRYRYRVRAFDRDGHPSVSSAGPVEARTALPPSPPPGLRAYSHLPRRVVLTWEPSPDRFASGYVVYRSPSAHGPFVPVARIDDRWQTEWVDAPLGDLRVFYYRVAAVHRLGGEGPPSRTVRAVTKAEPLPPLGLRLAGQRIGANRLAWEPNVERDIAGYRLLRWRLGEAAGEAGGGSGGARGGTTSARTGPAMPPGAGRARGETTPPAMAAAAPEVSGAPAPQGPPEVVAELGPEATEAWDPDVRPGERIAYRLVARDRDGLESAPSDPVEVVGAGYGLTARVHENGTVRLSWRDGRDEGFVAARVERSSWRGWRELARVAFPPAEAASPGGSSEGRGPTPTGAAATAGPTAPASETSAGPSAEATKPAGRASSPRAPSPRAPSAQASAELSRPGRTTGTEASGAAQSPAPGLGYRDTSVKPGHRYRYRVVFLRADGSEAPPSRPVSIEIPRER